MRIENNLLESGKLKLAEKPITEGNFFKSLHSGEMSLSQFRHTQCQFYFAVNYFSQPIAALFSRMSDVKKRMKLLLNLMDEHGNINLEHCHTSTFQNFLRSIDVDVESELLEGPEVKAFNAALIGVCAHEKEAFALAALGMIELAFSEVSSNIAHGVIERGWLNEKDLAHYAVHAKLDLEHAAVLFELAQSMDDASATTLEAGMNFGQFIFNRFYEDLYNASMHKGKNLVKTKELLTCSG